MYDILGWFGPIETHSLASPNSLFSVKSFEGWWGLLLCDAVDVHAGVQCIIDGGACTTLSCIPQFLISPIGTLHVRCGSILCFPIYLWGAVQECLLTFLFGCLVQFFIGWRLIRSIFRYSLFPVRSGFLVNSVIGNVCTRKQTEQKSFLRCCDGCPLVFSYPHYNPIPLVFLIKGFLLLWRPYSFYMKLLSVNFVGSGYWCLSPLVW